MWRKILFVGIFAALAACTALPIEKVPVSAPQTVPPGAQPSPIGFNRLRYAIPTGTTVMGISMRSVRCPMIMRKVQRGITARTFVNDTYRRLFRDTLESLGYDVTGDPGRLFDEREDLQRSIYSVGARVTDIKMDVCQEQALLFGHPLGYVGEAMIEVEWTVFDMLRRRNVYRTTTRGYSELKTPNEEGIELLLEDAFAAAAHNLGAEQVFFDLVFAGIEPAKLPHTYEDPHEKPLLQFDPQEKVILHPTPLSNAVPETLEKLPSSSVLIQTAGGHGSGFFITADGHLLTNAHVVGDAPRVRVVTSGKKERLIAEVLRRDRLRDVALLRVEELPPTLEIRTLPMRLEKPAVSEPVYAIGAPSLTKLQDTVTRGIVSAHRYDRREKQWYIQADVFTYGGNSGGPLLDENGNVVGISVSGYSGRDQNVTGLNLFIPIADALEALGIEAPGREKAVAPLDLSPE